jgi:acetyl-CoA synthetase
VALFIHISELQEAANRLSNLLVAQGVRRGDRVAIVLPQRFETAVAYMAVLQMGAVAMPLSILFGPEALEFRLQDSEAVLAICDEASIGAVQGVRARCPQLRAVIGLGAATARPTWTPRRPCGARRPISRWWKPKPTIRRC